MAFSKAEIFAAADRLEALGIAPTLQAVRNELGSGSYSTISEPMSEWRAKRAARRVRPLVELPEPVAVALKESGQQLWLLALETAKGQFEVERAQLQEQLNLQLEERNEAVGLADSLGLELEQLGTTLRLAQRKEAEALSRADALQTELAAVTASSALNQARAEEMALRVADLNNELQRLSTHNTELTQLLATLAPPRT